MTASTATTILGIDASRAACSAAVLREGRVLASDGQAMARGQAEVLPPMIERVLATAGIAHRGIGAIAVPVGPGSFTGIRIALAAARGLALVTQARLIGIDGFAAALEVAKATRPALVAIETGRGSYFVRRFGADPTDDTAVAILEAAAIAPLAPHGAFHLVAPAELEAIFADRADMLPMTANVADLAQAAARIASRILASDGRGSDGAALPARPLYVAPPTVTMAAQDR
ncbi:MAG: tRNA (adenosine(37)-N6)-threonylcarbamoyltransferase complex dimerization subunit type 1 TsaB [Rhodospirillaceae bacterium]|nr:tRNA (adenosine(37)-N6)-threonylcarbamoyltransferase complex dimerization subunit type 1 TsaB [Rhodospirillaceae bacterium]